METWIPTCISCAALLTSLYFSTKENNRSEEKETKEETTHMTEVVVKLNMVLESLQEIKDENKESRKEIAELRERCVKAEESAKQAHKRITELINGKIGG